MSGHRIKDKAVAESLIRDQEFAVVYTLRIVIRYRNHVTVWQDDKVFDTDSVCNQMNGVKSHYPGNEAREPQLPVELARG